MTTNKYLVPYTHSEWVDLTGFSPEEKSKYLANPNLGEDNIRLRNTEVLSQARKESPLHLHGLDEHKRCIGLDDLSDRGIRDLTDNSGSGVGSGIGIEPTTTERTEAISPDKTTELTYSPNTRYSYVAPTGVTSGIPTATEVLNQETFFQTNFPWIIAGTLGSIIFGISVVLLMICGCIYCYIKKGKVTAHCFDVLNEVETGGTQAARTSMAGATASLSDHQLSYDWTKFKCARPAGYASARVGPMPDRIDFLGKPFSGVRSNDMHLENLSASESN